MDSVFDARKALGKRQSRRLARFGRRCYSTSGRAWPGWLYQDAVNAKIPNTWRRFPRPFSNCADQAQATAGVDRPGPRIQTQCLGFHERLKIPAKHWCAKPKQRRQADQTVATAPPGISMAES
jgi:hypothetical protein